MTRPVVGLPGLLGFLACQGLERCLAGRVNGKVLYDCCGLFHDNFANAEGIDLLR